MQTQLIIINPDQTFEIYVNGNILVPSGQEPNFIIKNKGPAPIRAANYWASPFGSYNLYTFIDIQPGEIKELLRPPNPIYFYKVTAINLSNIEHAEVEVTKLITLIR
ncbi:MULTISPECIES: hypothetical protein [Photorhabdus]|uniref:Uncharacterized protein n=1 Tax=Photorhabdus thracensis TaxID=230089 RepID=A0A0F7LUQ4_9GAMM|nr:hypothetical protein [Photorhabdus thracensis]AKH65537.1 hypothetical protein VY86_21395 [Photorhabdus thracensis]MCC8421700.1 hypothetical protein [Photorhabdus thracensis]